MTNRSAARARPAPSRGAPPPRQSRVLAIALGAIAIVVAIGVVIALAGGDDGDSGTGTGDGGEPAVFGPVTVAGDPLPTADAEPDPAVGRRAPTLTGESPDGAEVTVGGGEPTVVAFLAHWCPHCQAELPVLVDVAEAGGFDGVRTVAVLTGSNADAPNFPPVDWLEGEGWQGDVFLDDEVQTAAQAYGLSSYPLLVALDADGNVVGRTVGEQPAEAVEALAAAARGDAR